MGLKSFKEPSRHCARFSLRQRAPLLDTNLFLHKQLDMSLPVLADSNPSTLRSVPGNRIDYLVGKENLYESHYKVHIFELHRF